MKIDINFFKRVVISFLWVSRNYLRFKHTLKRKYGVGQIKILDFAGWHGRACYFEGVYNKDKVFIKTLGSEFGILQNEQTAINVLTQNAHMKYFPQLYQYGRIGGDDFVVLEYIPGYTLDYHLNNGLKDFNADERLGIADQLIMIMEELHAKKIVHRDLRPDNIIVTMKNGVKLVLIDYSYVMDSDNWNNTPRFRDINQHIQSTEIWNALGQNYKPEALKWDDAYAIHKILNENSFLFNIQDSLLLKVKNKIGLEVFTIEYSN